MPITAPGSITFTFQRVPVAAIPPDRNRVLHHQDRQQDRERLQRRHGEREQRRRRHADAGEPALGEADQQHRDECDGEEERIGNTGGHSQVRGLRARRAALETLAAHSRVAAATFNGGGWARMGQPSSRGVAQRRARIHTRSCRRRWSQLQSCRQWLWIPGSGLWPAPNDGDRDGRPHQPLPRGLRARACATRKASGARRRRRSTGTSRAKKIFDKDAGIYGRWFTGAVCNTCYNAIDRHVERGRGEPARDHLRLAASPTPSAPSPMRSCCARSNARRRAAGLRRHARATASSSTCRWCRRRCSPCYACARIGAIHSVVFGGFAAKELATRIDDAKPKLILSASLRHRGRARRAIQAAAR